LTVDGRESTVEIVGAEIEIDARGLYCPIPVLRLAKAFRGRPDGTVAKLLATDPAAREDVEVFCREGGHELLEFRRDGPLCCFRVKKRSVL
jgi:tRNA 2-thiouridine synthesizing protein A